MAPNLKSPIRHFQADLGLIKLSQLRLFNVWSATGFYEVEEGIPSHILRK